MWVEHVLGKGLGKDGRVCSISVNMREGSILEYDWCSPWIGGIMWSGWPMLGFDHCHLHSLHLPSIIFLIDGVAMTDILLVLFDTRTWVRSDICTLGPSCSSGVVVSFHDIPFSSKFHSCTVFPFLSAHVIPSYFSFRSPTHHPRSVHWGILF